MAVDSVTSLPPAPPPAPPAPKVDLKEEYRKEDEARTAVEHEERQSRDDSSSDPQRGQNVDVIA
ncbi:MAG: hypothetical protein OEY85_15695 [Rhodospirillales bacterium]|nr:hypothetical protein [Rhodospirillales bacterium]